MMLAKDQLDVVSALDSWLLKRTIQLVEVEVSTEAYDDDNLMM